MAFRVVDEATRRATIEGALAASTEPRCARTAIRRLDAMAADLHGDATWDLYISDLAYCISRRAYGHDDADGRGRSHLHDDMRQGQMHTPHERNGGGSNAGQVKACAASRVPDDDDTDAGQVPH